MSGIDESGNSSAERSVLPDTSSGQRGESGRFELALYLSAAIIYIAVGFVRPEVFAWWSYGAAWFVAVVWFVPPLVRRVMKRLRVRDREERDST